MNALKQQWKQFIIWWINDLGYTDMKLDNFDIEYEIGRASCRERV